MHFHEEAVKEWAIAVLVFILYTIVLWFLFTNHSSRRKQKDETAKEKILKDLLVDSSEIEVFNDQLGRGQSGAVYRGTVNVKMKEGCRIKQQAAIKTCFPVSWQCSLLMDEAVALSRLRHPNIVRLLAVSRPNQAPMLAMEWLIGGSLKDYFRKKIRDLESRERPLVSLKDVLWILQQLADAVTYIHSIKDANGRELVHGDIATRNVLMNKKDLNGVHVKLCDLGSWDGGPRPAAWLPPEILCANDDNIRHTQEADVWMFGVMTWECLTLGATPHFRRSIDEIQRCYRLPDRGLICPHSCPLDMWSLIIECLGEAHRRPRCNAKPQSLANRINRLLENYTNSTHMVYVVDDISNCTCTEHRCNGNVH